MPVSPTARPPAWLMWETMALFTSPPSTISTTSMVSSSVTRIPPTNSLFLPIRVSHSPICGPPPCTTTGFIPTHLRSTMSRAKLRVISRSTIAFPPYLMTKVAPAKRWMKGRASASTRATRFGTAGEWVMFSRFLVGLEARPPGGPLAAGGPRTRS